MNRALKSMTNMMKYISFKQNYIHTSQINNAINSFKKSFEINPASRGIKNQKKYLNFSLD